MQCANAIPHYGGLGTGERNDDNDDENRDKSKRLMQLEKWFNGDSTLTKSAAGLHEHKRNHENFLHNEFPQKLKSNRTAKMREHTEESFFHF